ncbi:probable 5-oxoprolinase [Phialocephala subalpina]|uniref:Probable 5-oxoprolinase n=1 Tax=Phialocephala subalpina TaxID=576137 RepID=A0A1L7WYM9_9HELO|nr:probable 5-oxoprolinase [Phialocephala subalpina]
MAPHRIEAEEFSKSVKIAIDRGGTFTDVWAAVDGHPDIVLKLLSVDPGNYADAPSEGIRRVLEQVTGTPIPRAAPLPKAHIHSIRMGTTVATNALLERKGTRHALVVTKGFRDLIDIGNQARPRLFDLAISKPETLYDKVIEIDERVTVEEFSEDPSPPTSPKDLIPGVLVKGSTGELVRIIQPFDEEEARTKLLALKEDGIDALAICFCHSYIFPDHELRMAEIAMDLGFRHVSLSSTVGAKMIRMLARGSSASADAYLTPEIKAYVDTFATGFEGGNLDGVKCEFMQSDGGLVNHKVFSGLRGILSGPAGGVVGCARTSYDGKTPLVGFDMGGTSTDVSRYGGSFDHVFETTTAGIVIQSPQLDINTVAAGGGSILFWKNGLFQVGPQSAGAHPGPASYRKGGPLTVTDANLFLGRLIPSYFPAIFGPTEDMPLDTDIVAEKFRELTETINADSGKSMTSEEVAMGFIDVANESMSRPIRAITEARGYETGAHNLAVFGGAGGQHACELAKKLGISRIIIHKFSSILSAYGMALAEVVQEAQEPSHEIYSSESSPRLETALEDLQLRVRDGLLGQGISQKEIRYQKYLHLRYEGTETQLMIPEPTDGDYRASFEREHLRELSFIFPASRKVMVDDVRVRGTGGNGEIMQDSETLVHEMKLIGQGMEVKTDDAAHQVKVYFPGSGYQMTPVFLLDGLNPGATVSGPAVIIDKTQTIVLVPGSKASILTSHVIIDLGEAKVAVSDVALPQTVNPVHLSVFGHRFMGIAEQMGRTLQRTSLSLNIKERLDYSCAIFGPDGELVANAPHVPVHLGSMSYAVKYQQELHGTSLRPGDVLVSNHPEAGGTHLPDITVITPVFDSTGENICFFTASRGHHADIGGLGGTSMNPNSMFLWHEGAAIKSFFLVRDNKFDEEGILEILKKPGDYPGCAPARKTAENLSDLQAQIAANNKGRLLIESLMEEYGQSVVQFYMRKIQENAEIAVRGYLKTAREKFGPGVDLVAEDYMDNGSKMFVRISIDETGFGIFDFTGTTCEMLSNMNAPPAITYSALIYTLRLLIGSDIPMNQGCLAPTKIIIPKKTFLNPSTDRAVCAGNTQTSQRLVDLLLKAFRAAAASQGCMNCFGFFGRSAADGSVLTFQYGETMAGGSGAVPGSHGASGVQVHMTNTRTTDAEMLEKRYPVIVRDFSIREGSGGRGKWNGGNGIVRDIECRIPLMFSLVTERRVIRPYGMDGGEPGHLGANYWVQKGEDGEYTWLNIGPKGQVDMAAGDRCVVHTPGGGAWGSVEDVEDGLEVVSAKDQHKFTPRATGSHYAYVATQEDA